MLLIIAVVQLKVNKWMQCSISCHRRDSHSHTRTFARTHAHKVTETVKYRSFIAHIQRTIYHLILLVVVAWTVRFCAVCACVHTHKSGSGHRLPLECAFRPLVVCMPFPNNSVASNKGVVHFEFYLKFVARRPWSGSNIVTATFHQILANRSARNGQKCAIRVIRQTIVNGKWDVNS